MAEHPVKFWMACVDLGASWEDYDRKLLTRDAVLAEVRRRGYTGVVRIVPASPVTLVLNDDLSERIEETLNQWLLDNSNMHHPTKPALNLDEEARQSLRKVIGESLSVWVKGRERCFTALKTHAVQYEEVVL